MGGVGRSLRRVCDVVNSRGFEGDVLVDLSALTCLSAGYWLLGYQNVRRRGKEDGRMKIGGQVTPAVFPGKELPTREW